MIDSLYRLSDLKIFIILASVTTAISIVCIIFSKFFIVRKLRYRDNGTIGSISSLIGIIYGVLVGFIALYLLTNNDHASTAVQGEANALANIYRESQWLNAPTHASITTTLQKYINEVIQVEWPRMRNGKDIPLDGDYLINSISVELMKYSSTSQNEIFITQDILREIKNLYDAREGRISMSGAQLSPELWEVIMIGTILIIGINYAFRVNFYLHLFAISMFAIMAASMIFLLVTLDRPFQGEFIVEPDALQLVQKFIEHYEVGAKA